MIKLPCKENKCILYPSCMHRERIKCIMLLDWISNVGHNRKTWVYMKKHLKGVRTISGYERRIDSSAIIKEESKDETKSM